MTLAGQRTSDLRVANLSVLLAHLHLNGPTSRSQLVAETGLTRSAVKLLVDELVAAGLADELPGTSSGEPGRPSTLVTLRSRHHAVLAIEILADTVTAAAVGLGGVTLVERSAEVIGRPPSAIGELVGSLIDDVRAAAGAPVWHATGIAVAGAYDQATGAVTAPNLGWDHVALVEELESIAGITTPIVVGNEASLAALAAWRRGPTAGHEHLLYVSAEIGVGGGIISGGKPIIGANGLAGEIGHLPVRPDGHRCGCGQIGCWETEIGVDALLRRHPGIASTEGIVAAAIDGDSAARDAIDEHGRWAGLGLAALANIFDPGIIVVGGLLAEILPLVGDQVESAIAARSIGRRHRPPTVVAASIDRPALIGAAELAWQPLIDDPLGS